jgi:hypothetical protein
MIVLSFDTWEEFDNAIGDIASAFYNASLPQEEEEEMECARCGEWVKPSKHPSIGCDV